MTDTTNIDLQTASKDELVRLLKTLPVEQWNEAHERAKRDSEYRWNANLRNANLRNANLWNANLRNADLGYADLRNANLRSANLRNADLRNANLCNVNLENANLCNVNLENADLGYADLWNANLWNANLRNADLWNANLRNANLRNADLGYAKVGDEAMTVDGWADLLDLARVGKTLRLAFKRLPADRITGRDQNNGKHLIEWKPGRWVEAPDWQPTDACGGGLHLSPCQHSTRTYSSESLVVPVAFDPAEAVLLGDKVKVRRAKVLG